LEPAITPGNDGVSLAITGLLKSRRAIAGTCARGRIGSEFTAACRKVGTAKGSTTGLTCEITLWSGLMMAPGRMTPASADAGTTVTAPGTL
jgi:hypothetical protein